MLLALWCLQRGLMMLILDPDAWLVVEVVLLLLMPDRTWLDKGREGHGTRLRGLCWAGCGALRLGCRDRLA